MRMLAGKLEHEVGIRHPTGDLKQELNSSLEFREKVCSGHINAEATRPQMFFIRVDETTKQEVCV